MSKLVRFFVLWATGFVVFAVLDLVWIGVVAEPVYQSEVGSLLVLGDGMSGPRVVAALATWLLITLSLVCFVFSQPSRRPTATAFRGALMGLVIYGVYDLTNYAVLKGWTLKVTLLDIAWGTFACALVSAILRGPDRWFPKPNPQSGGRSEN